MTGNVLEANRVPPINNRCQACKKGSLTGSLTNESCVYFLCNQCVLPLYFHVFLCSLCFFKFGIWLLCIFVFSFLCFNFCLRLSFFAGPDPSQRAPVAGALHEKGSERPGLPQIKHFREGEPEEETGTGYH